MSRSFAPWIVALLLLAAVVIQPLSADVPKRTFTFDGYWWLKQSNETKTVAVVSMVDAARYGYLGGYLRAVQDVAKLAPKDRLKITGLISERGTLGFSQPVKVYVLIANGYYSSSKHLEIPLVYVVTCMGDQTLKDPTCKPYGAQQALPTPVP